MNTEMLKGEWKQLKGKVREKWGKLTDDDLTRAEGRRDILAGRIQERYGMAKEDALRELEEFERKLQ